MPVTDWSRSALGRRSARACGIALMVILPGAVVLALAPKHGVGERPHRSSPRATATGTTTRGARPRPSPVPASQVARARRVAGAFLAGYLPFAYGRGSASSVPSVTPALRLQLMRGRVQVTPVERRRRPRVVSLTAFGQAPGVVVATALIDDRAIANYAVQLTVRRTSRGWVVSRVDGG